MEAIAILFWLFVGLILYVHIGYPVIVVLLSRLRPEMQLSSNETPAVTLLIAAYNEEDVIAEKLENSLSLDYPVEKMQIVVAADGSDDRTVEIVQSYADRGVELSYRPERRGKMAAITNAMGKARGDVVVFSDANNLYSANVIRDLVAPFSVSAVGGVSGAKTIIKSESALGESEGFYWKYESIVKEAESRLDSCVAISGEVWALRRELFVPPPDGIINDDFFMGMQVIKQGKRLVYAPTARSYERVSPSAKDEMERRARVIAGRYQAMSLASKLLPKGKPLLNWQIISHKYLRVFIPFAMIGAFLCNLLLLVFPLDNSNHPGLHLSPPINLSLFVLQVLFYVLALIGNQFEKQHGIVGRILYIPTFLLNSNLAALIGFSRFVTGRQTVLWQRASR